MKITPYFAEFEYRPSRRSKFGAQGLFSSPRIGRSDPTLINNMHETEAWLNDLYGKIYDDDNEGWFCTSILLKC